MTASVRPEDLEVPAELRPLAILGMAYLIGELGD
jgi:hypothetical protein